MPFPRNPDFVGRTDDLERLHATLQQREPVGIRPAGLTGMGGIGKTQLAVEYVYRFKDAYPHGIFWINAAEPLARGLAPIGSRLRPQVLERPPDEQLRAAFDELKRRPGALLVFDNLEDPAQLARPVGAEASSLTLGCRILFTTRQRELGRFQPIEVSVLPEGPALQLLLRDDSRHPVRDDPNHPERSEARAVCRMLGSGRRADPVGRQLDWAWARGDREGPRDFSLGPPGDRDDRHPPPGQFPFFVPFPRNPDFVGRTDDLERLHATLQQREPVGIRPAGLTGMGGIGKTQLAVEYVYRFKDAYPHGIFWINAAEPLARGLAPIGSRLRPQVLERPPDEQLRAAFDELKRRPGALLVFDNLEDPAQLARPVGAEASSLTLGCRILFTTRQRELGRFQPIEVSVLPEGAALQLLLRDDSRHPVRDDPNHPERSEARAVCRMLGYLPLALELASAFLAEWPEVSLGGYRKRLGEEGCLPTLDSEVANLAAVNFQPIHEAAVAATLKTQWEALRPGDETARLVFRVAGQFTEAAAIPVATLGLFAGVSPAGKPGNPSPLHRSLKRLHDVRLIEELHEKRIRLHPLVREFARSLTPEAETPEFRHACARRVAEAFEDFATLENTVQAEGVDLAQQALIAALEFASEAREGARDALALLLRCLAREADHLRNGDPPARAGVFRPAAPVPGDDPRATGAGRPSGASARDACPRISGAPLANLPRIPRPPESSYRAPGWGAFRSVERPRAVHRLGLRRQDGGGVGPPDRCTAARTDWAPRWGEFRGVERRRAVHRLGLRRQDGGGVGPPDRSMAARTDRAPRGGEVRGVERRRAVRRLGLRRLDGGGVGPPDRCTAARTDRAPRWGEVRGVERRRAVHRLGLRRQDGGGVGPPDRCTAARTDRAPGLGEFRGVERRRAAHRLGLRRQDGGGVGPPDRCTAARTDWAPRGGEVCGHERRRSAHRLGLQRWDGGGVGPPDGARLHELTGHHDQVNSVALSGDGRHIVSGSSDGTVAVWDLQTGARLHELTGHQSWVSSVALSGDGRYIVSGSGDRTVAVWDLQTGARLHELTGHHDQVNYGHRGQERKRLGLQLGNPAFWQIQADHGCANFWTVYWRIQCVEDSIYYIMTAELP